MAGGWLQKWESWHEMERGRRLFRRCVCARAGVGLQAESFGAAQAGWTGDPPSPGTGRSVTEWSGALPAALGTSPRVAVRMTQTDVLPAL